MLSSSVGADFSENFKLPASDSKDAFDLLETRFPAQSGDTARSPSRPRRGFAPAVRRKMERVFAKRDSFLMSANSPTRTKGGGAAAISDDGKIAYATVQYDVLNSEIEKSDVRG